MDYEEYKTKKGDTWDMLSLLFYGSEYSMGVLLKANAQHRKVFIFEEGIVLKIPTLEDNDAAEDIPDWMEDDDFLEDDGLDDEVIEDGTVEREDW